MISVDLHNLPTLPLAALLQCSVMHYLPPCSTFISPLSLSLAVEKGKALTLQPSLESGRTANPPSRLHRRRNRPCQRERSQYLIPSKLLLLADSAVTPAGHLHPIPFPLEVGGRGPNFRLRGPAGGRSRMGNLWGMESEGSNTHLATVRLARGLQERTRICQKSTSKCCKVTFYAL